MVNLIRVRIVPVKLTYDTNNDVFIKKWRKIQHRFS